MPSKLIAAIAATSLLLSAAVPAYAFDCTVAKKPARAGAVGIDGPSGFVPLKPNPGTEEHPHGAFIAFSDGEQEASTFLHAPAHTGGVLPPVANGVQNNCDGKGLDSLEACFGP